MIARMLEPARAEMRRAAVWYEQRQAGLGRRFLEALWNVLDHIERQPDGFPRLETYRGRRQFRRARLRRFPYFVVYEYLSEETVIVAISHAKRRTHYWLRRKFDR